MKKLWSGTHSSFNMRNNAIVVDSGKMSAG